MAGDDYTRIYFYDPNEGAAILFCILFGFTTIAHFVQTWRFKCWKLTGGLPWGGTLYVAGFIMRVISTRNQSNLGIFIATQVLVLAGPPVFSVMNYLVFGRTLYHAPYLSMIHPGRVISTFLGLDIIVEILTGNGAAKAANFSTSPGQIAASRAMINASLVLQIVIFVSFIGLVIMFHLRLVKAKIVTTKLRATLALLYVSSSLILIRSIYRCIESWLGYESYLAWFYVFDAGLMIINSSMLNIWHRSWYLPSNNKAKDGVTERQGPSWVDKRPLWATVLDSFDIVGLIREPDKKKSFWEDEETSAEAATPSKGECA